MGYGYYENANQSPWINQSTGSVYVYGPWIGVGAMLRLTVLVLRTLLLSLLGIEVQ